MFWNFRKKEIKEIVQLEIAEVMLKIGLDFKLAHHLQKLKIRDGDIIVLRHPEILSEQAREVLKKGFGETLKKCGFDVHIIVLEEGMGIGVFSKTTTI